MLGTAGESAGGIGGAAGQMFRGFCEQHGYATATTDGYTGYEEFYVLSEEAAMDSRVEPVPEDMVCRIRVAVDRVGTAPAGCVDVDELPCDWTHTVEYSNPEVLIDVNGACARSEIAWDQAFIDGLDGSRVSYGYVDTWLVHDAPLRIYSQASSQWTHDGRAYWNDATGEFQFEIRHGACRY